MARRRFGLTKYHVPVIGQGTWHMEDDDRASAITALRLGLDLGMTHVDTAEMYGSGFVAQENLTRVGPDAGGGHATPEREEPEWQRRRWPPRRFARTAGGRRGRRRVQGRQGIGQVTYASAGLRRRTDRLAAASEKICRTMR